MLADSHHSSENELAVNITEMQNLVHVPSPTDLWSIADDSVLQNYNRWSGTLYEIWNARPCWRCMCDTIIYINDAGHRSTSQTYWHQSPMYEHDVHCMLTRGNFVVPRTRRRISDRTFSVAAPWAWNRLPTGLKQLQSTDSFHHQLKMFLS